MNGTNLDVMDDTDDFLEKMDDKIEDNNIIETPGVTVTVTVDTSGPSPPPARRMTFTGSPNRLLTRVGGFLKTIVTPRRRKRTSIVQTPPEQSPRKRSTRAKKKSKYDDNCSSIDKGSNNNNDNNNDSDDDNNNDKNPSSSPPPPASPPRLNHMTLHDGNIFEQRSDNYSLLQRTEGLIHHCIDDGWSMDELKILLKNLA